MTAQSHIEELLQQTMGLNAASVGTATVERAVRGRMARLQMKALSDYWNFLQSSERELGQLIEGVVVPETWFFRDREPFAVLSRFVLQEWLPTNASRGPLRLLSAPCATGEEPYSIAMTLLDAGLAPQQFHIDAVDISTEALAHAQRGVYSRNSFRGQTLDFQNRYFRETSEGHALHEIVREQIHFHKANLAAPECLPLAEPYDVIFCRNVLIYFDGPAQRQVIQTLNRLLTPEGILFVGHAEAGLFVESDFVSAKLPMAFAFRQARFVGRKEPKKNSTPRTLPARVKEKPAASSKLSRRACEPLLAGKAAAGGATRESIASASHSACLATPVALTEILSSREVELACAARLADAGQLVEAAKLCATHLQKHGASASAYYLLGVVRDAIGDKQLASECYRKTLYLEPDHYEALLQLALLAEQSGERHNASQWHHRARRVKERSQA